MESLRAFFELGLIPVFCKRLNVRWSHGAWRFEIPVVLVRLDHIASLIVNPNDSIMRSISPIPKMLPQSTAVLRVIDCVADCVWLSVPQRTEWQHIGTQINAAMIFAQCGLHEEFRARHCIHSYHFVIAKWRAKEAESRRVMGQFLLGASATQCE